MPEGLHSADTMAQSRIVQFCLLPESQIDPTGCSTPERSPSKRSRSDKYSSSFGRLALDCCACFASKAVDKLMSHNTAMRRVCQTHHGLSESLSQTACTPGRSVSTLGPSRTACNVAVSCYCASAGYRHPFNPRVDTLTTGDPKPGPDLEVGPAPHPRNKNVTMSWFCCRRKSVAVSRAFSFFARSSFPL